MTKRSRSSSISSLEGDNPTQSRFRLVCEEPAEHASKYAQLGDHTKPIKMSMRCFLPPHKPLTFPSQSAYETHYNQAHLNRCSSCHRNFPTAHFLNLHISENHDPIVLARRDRGDKTFACFVEGCEKVCADWTKRRSHLVDKHGFPRNYDFFVVDSGTEGKRSLLRPGVDADGHRASSRERKGSEEGEGVASSTEATSVSPPPFSEASSQPNAPTGMSDADMPSANPPWRGKKRSGSTRGSIGGPPIAPVKTGMDDVIKSMSSLSMVPRSVQRKS